MRKDLWTTIAYGIAILLFGVCCFFCGGGVFVVIQEFRDKKENYIYERDTALEIISSDPAFAKVEVNQGSWGGIYLLGKIDMFEDFQKFETKIRMAFGKKHADNMMGGMTRPVDPAKPSNKK